jgi:Zn-dependent M16 (insulinase) family peptidase
VIDAWTDVDHTCYTVEVVRVVGFFVSLAARWDLTNVIVFFVQAGSEGFLNLLPVYLDHVLYPTLTDTVHALLGPGQVESFTSS